MVDGAPKVRHDVNINLNINNIIRDNVYSINMKENKVCLDAASETS